MAESFGILPKGFKVNGKYSILLFVKRGRNAETYRVKNDTGKLFFLKIFDLSKLTRSALSANGTVLEVDLLSDLKHENIVSLVDSGELIVGGRKLVFSVHHFIVGETLIEHIVREPIPTYFDVQQIIVNILDALHYLHTLPDPIIHNEVTPNNIMLDLSESIPKAKLIDFGYARKFHMPTNVYDKIGLNLNYVAPECLNNLFSPQSDIYSVGVIMYQLIYRRVPKEVVPNIYVSDDKNIDESFALAHQRPLLFEGMSDDFLAFDNTANLIIKKAITSDLDDRFASAQDFKKALLNEVKIEDIDFTKKMPSSSKPSKKIPIKKASGKGFAAIAGMQSLKDQLQEEIINALLNPEEYSKYGITIPNGLLLYGPPGCGKTFFAKHFAEEVGFNFIEATPATLKSRYVNATQENIAKMFADAAENAPTIIFIDEINELLPHRDGDAHEMSIGAVNEMLAQMDRTGEKGIFVIGATNYPDLIDPAMLRSGRLDKKVFLPPPDKEARKAIFELTLQNRPLDFGIDYNSLADLTENFVSSDIEYLVNEAARSALKTKSRITNSILEDVIKKSHPSVPISELNKYKLIKAKMDGQNSNLPEERPRIGFKT